MCWFSVNAENTRDAKQGENLVVTQAPHGASNWLTSPGDAGTAVCVRGNAQTAVERPDVAGVRGATFEQQSKPDEHGRRDFMNYIDGAKEKVALNDLPPDTKVRVLRIFAEREFPTKEIPATLGIVHKTTVPLPNPVMNSAGIEERELVGVGVRAGGGNSASVPQQSRRRGFRFYNRG